MKPITPHWADQTATRIIATCGEREQYTVASGITPSGTVHIGNFREVITVDLVARALRSLGKKVRFLYSWDDFDTLRKVPKGLPNPELLEENLRRPICRVPDPFERDESYASHHIHNFERQLQLVGIEPEFLYQSQRYGSGMYAEQIRHALERKDEIRAILNQHRTKDLGEDWLPTAVYCESCGRDQMHYQRYLGEYGYAYHCASCGHEAEIDIRKTSNLKLNWRTDWPMRWAYEQVDFEPGGKDHSSEGGSYDTGKVIVQKIWNRPAPQYLQYDFVFLKGGPGKMSSSAGGVITLEDACAVYEPQMVRWIFASQRPNTDFAISFDSDVIKVYDEFDRAEQAALGPAPEKPGKWPVLRRNYELSCVAKLPAKKPYRAPFRDLCSRLQIFDGDVARTMERFYRDHLQDPDDQQRFRMRAERALFWLENYATHEFRYRLNVEAKPMELSAEEKAALLALHRLVESCDLDQIEAKDLNQLIYDQVIRGVGIESKQFFQLVYQKLISRDQGPRLPSFLKEIGRDRLLTLLA